MIASLNQYERRRGEEDKIWNNTSNRLLFITKESNTADYPYDMRSVELTRNTDGTKSIGNRHFNRNLLRLSAGLSKINKNNFIPFADVNEEELYSQLMDNLQKALKHVEN